MKKAISYIRNSHAGIYKLVLFLLAVSIIVYLFPKEGKFKYEFHNLKGKPWNFEDLIAPFDFSIKKSTQELEMERAEVVKNFHPCFTSDTGVYSSSLKRFQQAVELWPEKNSGLKERTLKAGVRLLDSVYKRGILQPDEVVENKAPDYLILLLHNNVADERELNSFYTIASAVEFFETVTGQLKGINKEWLKTALADVVAQDVLYNKAISDKFFQQALDEIVLNKGKIQKGEAVISKGEIVDETKYQALESLKLEYEQQGGEGVNYFLVIMGHYIVVTLCLLMLAFFTYIFRSDIFNDSHKLLFILLLIILMVAMAVLPRHIDRITIYYLPFCILPVIIRTFFDTRLALFIHLVTILIVSFFAPERFYFVFIQFIAGIVSIFSIVNLRNRSQFFTSSALIFLAYGVAHLGLVIVQEGRVDTITWNEFIPLAISSFLTLFCYPLIFLFEKIFGFVSDVTLMELSDTNSPLLRELASKAPGTFQHSLQVASLAEEAIYSIGGNPLLVRTGALYHDIGKTDMAIYFTENQNSGINPHQELGFEESASIIIGHVIKGIEKAREANLPEQIIDFIRTHHGTTKTEYFFRLYKKETSLETIEEEKFRYPGPVPYSKETAVLMMADTVEASSRSLKSYDADTIDHHVEQMIEGQIKLNQFINADITLKDITTIKKIFKKKLMNIYHVRVEYPKN